MFESIPFYNDSWKNISSKAKEFVKKILKKDKEERITIDQILSDPWLEDFNEDEEEA